MDFQHDILPLKNILFRTALRIVLSREEAEDIVQDTLLKLWQRRDELAQVQNLEAFALTAVRHLAIDRKERLSSHTVSFDPSTHDRPDEAQVGADRQMMHDEAYRTIDAIVAELPEKQRTIVQWRDIEGKSYKEIAEILNITESDVKVSLFRARNNMREKLLQKKSFFL